MAGKGDSLRKGANLSAYWSNYDDIFRRRKTVYEWQKHFGHVIKSYDGFREYREDDLLTKEEYESGYIKCTVQLSCLK
jgi:hypothetical protein